MKRKWLLLFGVFVVAVLVAGYFLIPVGEGRISQANCNKIQEGWRQRDVQELLGGDTCYEIRRHSTGWCLTGMSWRDEDDNIIRVGYDSAGHVNDKRYTPTDLSFPELVKRRIQRRLKAVWP
jgi:hypothetical protein